MSGQKVWKRLGGLLAGLVLAISSLTILAGPVAGAAPGPPVSDDFNTTSVNSSLWTVHNPVGDGTASDNGSQLLLAIPAGTDHDVWAAGNRSLGLFQPVANGDFQVDAKFDSLPSAGYQSEGILAEQDANTVVRFDVYFDGSTRRVFAATFSGGVPTAVSNVPIAIPSSSVWLRVQRQGNSWIESWSSDGTNFTVAATFNFTLSVAEIGPFAGNAANGSSPPPAWTVKEDYFHNTTPAVATPPSIDVWYGQNQTFGAIGQPQTWVNVLGNVSDPVGLPSLSYTLNGGPSQPLSVGPDATRLPSPGDFNVEMPYTSLKPGSNTVIITAVDSSEGLQSQSAVNVQYDSGNTWPLPYSINWSQAGGNINSVAQVVDGNWTIEPDGTVRTLEVGYDRLIAIGDAATWKDY